MDWIGIPVAAVISVLGGIVTLIVGRRIDKAHGIPNDLESKLISEMREYAQALEGNNLRLEREAEQREAAQIACETRLEEAEIREARILRRLDDAEGTIVRLRIRLGEDVLFDRRADDPEPK